MYSFRNDYSEGAHRRILETMMKTNIEQSIGYGEDEYSRKAIDLIKKRINKSDVDIHLIVGGTQTNLISIGGFLRPHEAVIAPSTGHILVHEAGAIEATGHKIISMPSKDGKLKPQHISEAVRAHTDEHMVKPKLVYISNPTEIGTIYKKSEVEEISKICKEKNLLLYVDGARLGAALASEENDMDISDLAKVVDAFYIGGTKGGALMGEALIICNDNLKSDFRYHIKQRGAMFAKGRILGIQFLELFRDNLYFDLAKHANNMAAILTEGIKSMGYDFMIESSTNQIFPILPNIIIEKLEKSYEFYIWEKVDEDKSAIRLVTSWATDIEKVKTFIAELKKYNL